MRTRSLLALAFLIPALVLVAGCIGSPTVESLEEQNTNDSLPETPPSFDYPCPPGETSRRGDLCIQTISDRSKSLQEPFLAQHPTDEDVLALGVNAGPTTTAPNLNPDDPRIDEVRLDVYVTTDGGGSWEYRPLPPVPADDTAPARLVSTGDPTLAWAPNGTLYLAGIVNHDATTRRSGDDVFVTSSDDRGKTWTTATVLTSDDDNDRPWLSISPRGTVLVAWQNFQNSTQVALQQPTSRQWSIPVEQGEIPCIHTSPTVAHEGDLLLACTDYPNGSYNGIDVFEVQPKQGLEYRGSLNHSAAIWPKLLPRDDGGLLMVTEGAHGSVYLTTSSDGGQTWGPARNLSQRIAVDDEMDFARINEAEVDPAGSIHLMLKGGDDTIESHGVNLVNRPPMLGHVILASDLSGVLQETRLDPPDDSLEEHRPETLGRSFGDHTYGLEFGGGAGTMIWTQDGALEMTLVDRAEQTR